MFVAADLYTVETPPVSVSRWVETTVFVAADLYTVERLVSAAATKAASASGPTKPIVVDNTVVGSTATAAIVTP